MRTTSLGVWFVAAFVSGVVFAGGAEAEAAWRHDNASKCENQSPLSDGYFAMDGYHITLSTTVFTQLNCSVDNSSSLNIQSVDTLQLNTYDGGNATWNQAVACVTGYQGFFWACGSYDSSSNAGSGWELLTPGLWAWNTYW